MRLLGLILGAAIIAGGYIYFQENRLAEPQQLDSSDDVQVYQLGNGMKVLVQEDHRAPVVVSQVWYKVGSSYEPGGITGVSHVLEHLMFKGTAKHPAGEFSEIIAANGGRENAFTSKDYTAYFQRIASDRLELCLQLEADRMRNLTLAEDEFKKEVEVVKEERRLRTEDKPTSLTYERFNAAAYFSSPYGQPVIGWMEDLDQLTIEDLRQWYQTWYAPNNATLVVSGDVKTDEVVRLANKYFGVLEPSNLTALKPRKEVKQQGVRRIEVKAPAKVPYLLMGYKVPTLATTDDETDVYALEVLSGLLDGGSSARLSRNLVRGQQIATSAGASYNPYDRLDTLFLLSGLPNNGHTLETLESAFKAELQQLLQQPPTQAELDRVKAQVIAADVYEKDSTFYQAMQLGTLETVGLGWQKKNEYIDKLSAVTAEQVQQVIKKYFDDDVLTVAQLVPVTINSSQQPVSDEEVADVK